MKIDIQPKKQMWKKVALIIGGITWVVLTAVFLLVLLAKYVPGTLSLVSKDIDPIDDSDLHLQKIVLAETDNAYYDLIKLEEVVYDPTGESDIISDIVAGNTWDEKIVEEIVSRNTRAFEYFSDAANKPKFQDSAYSDPSKITINTIAPPMSSWRKMSRFSAIRAMYLAKQGKSKEAFEEALNSVRIGQKIQDSQVSILGYLVAVIMKGLGIETIQKIIVSSNLNTLELEHYIQEVNQFYNNENGLITAFKVEYHIQSWTIDSIVSGDEEILEYSVGAAEEKSDILTKVKSNHFFKPNKTKSILAGQARANMNNAKKLCSEIKPAGIQKLTPSSKIKLFITDNIIGKMLHDIFVPHLTGLIKRKCKEDLLVASTQILLALKAFKSDNGNLPASLDQLIPQYMQNIPEDPFDGKPIRYSSIEKIIYSVGDDMVDSGGSTGDDWRKMSDPTFIIGF